MNDHVSIYALVDPWGAIRYVGKTSTSLADRLVDHLRTSNSRRAGSTYKSRWIASLKRLGLRPSIILIQTVPEPAWPAAEKYWIQYFRSNGSPLTNSAEGGEGAAPLDEFAKLSISLHHRGKTISPEHRAAVGAAAKRRWEQWRANGCRCSEETRAKVSAANTGRKHPDAVKERVRQQFLGKPKSAEHRAKISAALTGKPKSPSHRLKCLKNLGLIDKEVG